MRVGAAEELSVENRVFAECRANGQRRLGEWKQPELRYKSGVLAKYASLVSQANDGAITKPIL